MGNFYKETRTNAFRIARHSLVDFGCKGNHFFQQFSDKVLIFALFLYYEYFFFKAETLIVSEIQE